MTRSLKYGLLALVALLTSCMKRQEVDGEDFSAEGRGLFIVNEGNFQYGNATLSYYDVDTRTVTNEVFLRANGQKLGDVAQSMTIRGGIGWIVVNNSHVVFAIDVNTFREVGRIENLPSPRYIHFVSDDKAYITQIWDNKIYIVDPRRYRITGTIEVPGMAATTGSTEQIVRWGQYVYVNCWSYQSSIIKIDTLTDRVVSTLEVGMQPQSMVIDCYGRLWVVTDGGYEGSVLGQEAPTLIRINAETFEIEQRWKFRLSDTPRNLCTNGTADKIYWINADVWCMDADAVRLPVRPVISSRGTIYYGLTVDPVEGDIYVADAIDYQQPGIVYRYDSDGAYIDKFYVGINPGGFAWK